MLRLSPEARKERLRNAERLRQLVRRTRPLSGLAIPTRLTWRAALLAGTMLSAQSMAQTLPQGGQVVAGAATIAQPSANQMVITQSTQRAAINWQSFNIGTGNGVQFVQPSSNAIALNRVVGLSGPSQILGSLTANGQVYIVNPQGVVFGRGAMVNTGALLATTRDISTQQFMAGGDVTLTGGSTGAGKVVNKGTIATQPGGYVVLAGDKVVNKGTINTPEGRTVLAAGDQATVALSNGQLVNVTMNASVADATVKNKGVIKAEGGKVVLSANGAGTVIGGAINLTGTVDVSSALAGDILVDAGPKGTVNATGATIKAVSTAGKGGNVTLAGDRVGLFDGTKVNVSGKTGGGTVLAGGGVQGKDASVRNASVTVMAPNASIDASATDNGDGGTVVLWSNDYTGFDGTITAQGANDGKGGWIETSSHDNLQAWGHVVLGAGGEWLLDPSNVTIANANTANNTFNSSSGVWVPNASNATINVASINAQLDAGTTVIVTTNSGSGAAGNLNINANITKTAGGNASLTLRANGTIFDNGMNISSTVGVLNVTMNASNGVVLSNGSAFSLNGGNLTIIGVGNGSQVGVNIGQATVNASNVTINGTTNTGAFAVNVFGALNASATQLLTINGVNGTAASVNIGAAVTANNLIVKATAKADGIGIVVGAAVRTNGDLTLNGTGLGSTGGGMLITSSACASGNIRINGSANNGIAVNSTGTINASSGNVTIDGTANNGRAVRLSGTIVAAGTLNVTGNANDANGLAVPLNLTIRADGGATLIGNASTANGINISATLNAADTPSLLLNGTTNSGGGSSLNFFGVNVTGIVTAANLTIIGRGVSGADDIGGIGVVGGSIRTAGDLTLDGRANNGVAVNSTGVINASGNVTIDGTSNTGRGVRLSGIIEALGTVTANGHADDANGLAVPLNLTLAAAGGATLTGTANTANGVNISATLDATGTPSLTIEGCTTGTGAFYGANISGIVNAANLTIVGHGVSEIDTVGGVNLSGSTCTTGSLSIIGTAGNGTGVNISGTVNASGDVTVDGTSNSSRGVRLAGSITAGGSVNVTGKSTTAAGIGVADNLTLAAAGGATWIGSAPAANGINISASVNATATPLLVLNGTTLSSNGGVYGVTITGAMNVASLTVNGVGNLNATGNVGGTFVTAGLNASGNLTLNGRTGGALHGVFAVGSFVVGGDAAVDGTSRAGTGVTLLGLNANGTATIAGRSDSADGVNVSGFLASRGGTITGSTNSGQRGVLIDSGFVQTTGSLVVNGTGGSLHGVAQAGTIQLFVNGSLTVNSNSGIAISGVTESFPGIDFSATYNANRFTLSGARFGGPNGTVVLQAFDSASAMLVNGSGANFSNVASVVIGSTNQAANLDLAAPLTYGGAGNLSVVTGTANILLNGNINASAGSGSVILSAGNGVPVDVNQSSGNVTGGDVVVGTATSIAAGAAKPVVIYSGNANSATLAALVANGATSQTKAYATLAGAGAACSSSALNLFYRVAPSLSVTLGNATGANVGKTYDGVGVALGYAVSGFIDGDNASSFNVMGNLGSSLPLDNGQALHAGNYTVSQGNAIFAAAHNYAVCVSNGTIVISAKALTVTAQSVSKEYDGTVGANGMVTVCGTIAGDSFSASCLTQAFGSSHALGIGNSSLNIASALTNTSFASSPAGSYITDYDVSYVTAPGTITPKALTVTAQSDTKVYDGTNASNLTVVVCGTIAGDSFSNAALAQVYDTIHAGNATLNIGAALADVSCSTAGSLITDYSINYSTANGTITPRGLTVTAQSASKVYDGTKGSNATAVVCGTAAGDSFTSTSLAQIYDTTHAGNATLNIASALTNGSFANGSTGLITDYCVSYVTADGTITPKALTVTATSGTKTYDGTVNSSGLATVNGAISGDTFTNASLAQLYNSSHALGASGSVLNVAAPLSNGSFATSSSGSWITDYNVSYVTANGTITAKALTVTATSDTKAYDGTVGSNATATVNGAIAGDTFNPIGQAFNSSHVLGTNGSRLNVAAPLDNASIACSTAGSWITDYDVSYARANGTITPKALTVTATTDTKVYDGTVNSSALATVSGAIAGDTFNPITQVFNNTHVLTINGSRLNVSGPLGNGSIACSTAGSWITDYSVSYVTAHGTITPRDLTVTATGGSKIYDGTNASAALVTVIGNIAGDSFTNASLAQRYNTTHAGNATLNIAGPLTTASFATNTSGSLISDYNVSYGAANGTITPKALTVTVGSTTKVYDGTAASNTAAVVCGTIAGDSFSNAALAVAFNSSHALGANGSTLNVAAALTNVSCSTAGSRITDYDITYVTALGTITPKSLTVTSTGSSKVYDGTVNSTALATVSGNIAGDTFTSASRAEAYNTTHAGNATLNVAGPLTNGSFACSTSDSWITDYDISYSTAAGTITPKSLTVTATGGSKVYDGTNGSTALVTVAGAIAGDTFTSASLAQLYNTTHAGNATLNIAAPLSNGSFATNTSGSFITDYCVSYGTANGTITPKGLTVTAMADAKVYDGTTTSTVTATVVGAIAGDTFSPIGQAFNGSHALGSNGSRLNAAAPLDNASFAGSTAGSFITDYCVSYVTANGTISRKPVTVTSAGSSKVYDGTAASNATAAVCGTIAGDSFTNASLAEVYSTIHAGNATLNVAAPLTNASFAGSSTGSFITDYDVSYVSAAGTITPRTLTVRATGGSKVYDGTTASSGTAIVGGTAAGDSFSAASLVQAYSTSHAGNVTLNVASALNNGSFAIGSVGLITDYCVSYVQANGMITPKALTVMATTDTKVYDGTANSGATATVNGGIAGDTFNPIGQAFGSTHALGTGNSTLNVSAPLTNASFAGSAAGSWISDYSVIYVTATGTVTPRPLSVTATSDTKVFDGTTISSQRSTVSGNIAGDTFSSSALTQVFANAQPAGTNNSLLIPAAPLTNASFASSPAGSWITDYAITYTAAPGTILPTSGGSGGPGVPVVPLPPSQANGFLSGNMLALGTWLNSGGQQQNIPAGLLLNDNILHLIFSTGAGGQPVVQASWEFFNANFSGSISLPLNTSAPGF
jgi:filamentous hemagglutinin family protein